MMSESCEGVMSESCEGVMSESCVCGDKVC